MPQPGLQLAPFEVSVQVTPLPEGSFSTFALKKVVPPGAYTVLTLFPILTEMGAVTTAKLAESDFVLSCWDVAVSVTLGGAGADAGGV